MARYQDWTGERKQKCKRGFATKREAAQWEQQFILQKKASMDMELESFCKLYEEDVRPRLKKSTWFTKENIIKSKILPYLGKRKVSEITAKDVLDWHNELRKLTSRRGKPLSPTYLKTIHGQLSTIFNHAIKFYDLSTNPARKAGTIGSEESKEMLFWTKAEYKQFSEEMMDKPLSYYAFQLLYWCGIRSGELLALTPADFNLQKRTLRINKSYQRLKGEDVISTPKTKNSRSVLIVGRIKDEPEIRVVCHVKSSLAPEGKSIAFRLDKETGFEWIGEYDISADDLLSGDSRGQKSRKAKEFLLEILANGGMAQKKIEEEAERRGIKKKTLRNAKLELEIDSVKRGNQWFWMLSE